MAVSLPDGVHVRVEAVVQRCEGVEGDEERVREQRSSLHVQSHSEWAPANIGPYSQAYTVSQHVYTYAYGEREGEGERE